MNEPIAYGEAAPDLAEYCKTRLRWGHGNIHALMHENILCCKGLSLQQRLHYLIHGLIHLEGWQQLMLIAIPMMTLVFGLQPFEISVFNIAVIMLFPLLSYGLLRIVAGGYTRFWAGEILAMARWPVHLKATLGLLGRPIPWLTTRKGFKAHINWRLMTPQLCVIIASLAACAYGAVRLNGDFQAGPLFDGFYSLLTTGRLPVGMDFFAVIGRGYTADLVIVAGFWVFYNALRGMVFVRKVLKNAHQSETFFCFPVQLSIKHGAILGRSSRISEVMIECELEQLSMDWDKGDVIPLLLEMPEKTIEVRVQIHQIIRSKKNTPVKVMGHFIWGITPEKRDSLASYLYLMKWTGLLPKKHSRMNNAVQHETLC